MIAHTYTESKPAFLCGVGKLSTCLRGCSGQLVTHKCEWLSVSMCKPYDWLVPSVSWAWLQSMPWPSRISGYSQWMDEWTNMHLLFPKHFWTIFSSLHCSFSLWGGVNSSGSDMFGPVLSPTHCITFQDSQCADIWNNNSIIQHLNLTVPLTDWVNVQKVKYLCFVIH